MRINIEMDDELVKKAFQYSKAKTKEDLITDAPKALIASRQEPDLRDLRGKIAFRKNYCYKKIRRGY